LTFDLAMQRRLVKASSLSCGLQKAASLL